VKSKNFLSAEFWLWFPCWWLLFVVSLFVNVYYENIGISLIRFSLTLLIALLTTMAAFNNMDANERKKQMRDDFRAFSNLLIILQRNYFSIYNLRKHMDKAINLKPFIRSIQIAYLLVKPEHEGIYN
jgi:glucan phosphoethanolaminetransferase (alkaline phosphatase superfamily)